MKAEPTGVEVNLVDEVRPLNQLNKARPAVLHVLPRLNRDDGTSTILPLLQGLRNEGWNVLIAAAFSDMERELLGAGIQLVKLPLATRNPLLIWLNSRRLARLIAEQQVKLVHAHDKSAAWSGALAVRATDATFLTSVHSICSTGFGNLGKRFDGIMTAGDRVVVNSDYLADALQRLQPVDPGRLRIIRPGVDLTSCDPSSVRGHRLARLSERWQLSLDHKIVLVPGAVTETGGQIDLLNVMAKSPRRDWQLLMIGDLNKDSAYVKAMERTILAAGLADRVVFGGACDDMAAAFMMADLVALPATAEDGLAHFAIQAQALGKPVLVTDCGSLPEAVMPAATGWLVPQGNLGEMSRAIDLALDMADDVKVRLAQRAREFAAEEFSLAQMIRRTSQLYRELVRDAPRPRIPTNRTET